MLMQGAWKPTSITWQKLGAHQFAGCFAVFNLSASFAKEKGANIKDADSVHYLLFIISHYETEHILDSGTSWVCSAGCDDVHLHALLCLISSLCGSSMAINQTYV